MGSKYTTLATSGYNSSPPADDGSQVAANLISWATQKTKLTDPVKTLADAINSALVTAFDYSVRQITASDNTVASDHMKCVEIAPTVTTAVTVSLGDAATMTNNYRVFVKNSSARNQTVSRVTGGDTIDGVAGSITLPPLSGGIFQTTTGASGYLTVAWFGPTSDGTSIVAGGTDGTKKVRLEVDGLTTATTRVITVGDRDFTIGKSPTRQVLTSGTAATYTTPSGATYINVRMAGGGAGGAGSGNGGDGTASTWSGGTLSAGGGTKGTAGGAGGAGGTSSNGDVNLSGGSGTGAISVGGRIDCGGCGGNSAYGGAGGGGAGSAGPTVGLAGATNTGGGGGGGASSATGTPGSGGGAGGYCEKLITAPAGTYTYTVGAAGAAGTGSGTTAAGGAGGSGIIIVDEYYN